MNGGQLAILLFLAFWAIATAVVVIDDLITRRRT